MKPTRIRPYGPRQFIVAVLAAIAVIVCATDATPGRRHFALTGQQKTGLSQTPAPSSRSPYSIRWLPDPTGAGRVIVEVTGLSATTRQQLRGARWTLSQYQRLFPVTVEQTATTVQTTPAMLGTYHLLAAGIRFESRFPFEPDTTYRAAFLAERLPIKEMQKSLSITSTHRYPARNATPTTAVVQVYPSAETLPENLLKFYLHFSASMSRGHIYDHIHLLDSAGKEVELPFLEIDEELWDDDMKRLTLFIDPGRIKRGVLPLEDVGPALEEGKRYTLLIDRAWKDGAGNPLKESYRKSFQVGPPDREPPDPAQWTIQPPQSGTRESLTILFPEAMDHALTQRVIVVTNTAGKVVDGQTALSDGERRWSFTPRDLWNRGAYQLVIQTTIEDLAGNNIGKPFDVDLFEGVQRRLTTATVKLPFELK